MRFRHQRAASTKAAAGTACLMSACLMSAILAAHAHAADVDPALRELPLLTAEDLTYAGAFRVPKGRPDRDSFGYGGTGLAYNAARDALFLVGHVRHQRSAEISIPELVASDGLGDLHTAEFVQPFVDALEGNRRQINPKDSNDQRIGGHLVVGDTLVVSAYSNYDGSGTQSGSHFRRPLALAERGARGPYAVGRSVHLTSAYMAPIPPAWRDAFGGPALTGNCCRSIIGNQSRGPAVSVFDPTALGDERNVGAELLLAYTGRPLGPGSKQKNAYYNLTSRVDGVVFPDGSRSILFFGKHGVGDYCYGEAEDCGDRAMPYKGTHAYPYVYQVWAYDALELLPHGGLFGGSVSVEPYTIWTFNLPFESDDSHGTGGAAYDANSGRIYFSQLDADLDHRPLIHAFRVARAEPGAARTD